MHGRERGRGEQRRAGYARTLAELAAALRQILAAVNADQIVRLRRAFADGAGAAGRLQEEAHGVFRRSVEGLGWALRGGCVCARAL